MGRGFRDHCRRHHNRGLVGFAKYKRHWGVHVLMLRRAEENVVVRIDSVINAKSHTSLVESQAKSRPVTYKVLNSSLSVYLRHITPEPFSPLYI